jgi:hypothetical protein
MENQDFNFHIFIASCIESLDTHVPRLIENILSVNIPPKFVHFIIGGCDNETSYYDQVVEIIKVNYRCFEFTPLIYIVKNPDKFNFDYAFFVHDTVKFGNNFYNTIKNDIIYLKGTKYETMKIENNLPSMNIGIYSKNIILQNKETLLDLCMYKWNDLILISMKYKLVEFEDFILKINNYNNGDVSENVTQQFIGKNGTVANGLLRIFKRIDLIKYQSNAHSIQSIDILLKF